MSAIDDVIQRKEVQPYVRFERVSVEDVPASNKAGHYAARDVDMALITPPYSKDIFKTEVAQWFQNLEMEVRNGRVPEEWVAKYKRTYEAWKNGQELPLEGSPIKGWGRISPAQQDVLIRMNILTLEDLALINDEGMRRIGMGAIDMRNKAVAELAAAKDIGPVVMENSDLKKRLTLSEANVGQLTATVKELQETVRIMQGVRTDAPAANGAARITAEDLVDAPAEPQRKRAKG